MTFKKKPSNDVSFSKVKSSTKALSSSKLSSSKSLSEKKIAPRRKLPDVSVVNVIERISKLLREEIHHTKRKKAIGE